VFLLIHGYPHIGVYYIRIQCCPLWLYMPLNPS